MIIRRVLFWFLTLCTAGVCTGTAVAAFETLDSAARAALSEPADPVLEQAGVVFVDAQGRYTYTAPQASKRTDRFELRVNIPRGLKIAAVYHTHPDSGPHELHGDFFTPADVELANKLGVPSYILTLRNGEIRKYIPGSTQVRRDRALASGKISYGEVLR